MSFNWWMEQSAVWMEDRSWDDVNDYIFYLKYFFDYPTTSLNENNYNFKYGAGIWPMYLSKRFGDDVIKGIWEQAAETKNESISIFGNVIPGGLGNALNEFAAWNYFSKDRANDIDFHHDSSIFKYQANPDYISYKSGADSSFTMNHLTSRYVEMYFAGEWDANDSLKVSVLPLDGGNFRSSVIFYKNPVIYTIKKLEFSTETIAMGGIWEKVVLVIRFRLHTIKNDINLLLGKTPKRRLLRDEKGEISISFETGRIS